MRHIRMLGLCLVAAFAVSVVAATNALAHQVEPKTGFHQFKNCPASGSAEGTEPPEVKEAWKCSDGETRAGEGGSYTVGGITVNITKPIRLQGAFTEAIGATREERIAKHREGILIPPEDGVPPVSPAAETVPGEVLGNISEAEMEEFGWPQELKESYKRAQKHHWFEEGKTTELIEAAGHATDYVSEYNILSEASEAENGGPGIIAKVQIQGRNKWLASLGGNCQIGSEANPIVQELWTGEIESPLAHETMRGTAGFASLWKEAQIADLEGVELVANGFAVPGAEKCGGASNEAYLDPVVDRAFGLPAPAGASTTRLIGELDVMTAFEARERGL